ncbi:7004_t:CDS:2 [Acaulospora morrowiae]|uniref:7004_t:CDS:1 n=1 Tax=Acaulospora morrowiae TaxID=94023 RepID=A0A9N9EIM7_9GLOM|nr:7004_t:CDS:2 [Acaulospora morrowiae]
MSQMQGDILLNKRQGFFNFMSYTLFNERLSETETLIRINTIVDEFQFIFTDHELLNAAKRFFKEISSSEIIYVAMGTFILVDLMKDDGYLGSPFNKATFKQMSRFSTKEMGTIFHSYQVHLNKDGIPPDLQIEIERDSCGHPASFMILLKLFHDCRPTTKGQIVGRWRVDVNLVCFTSCIILRVCIEALFPAVQESLPKHVVPEDPIGLLVLGLKFIDPNTIIDESPESRSPIGKNSTGSTFSRP